MCDFLFYTQDNLKEVSRQKFFSVHELATPLSVQQLSERVETGLGYDQCGSKHFLLPV